jgi:transcriptional regulator of acetoin/glycerol metabolism
VFQRAIARARGNLSAAAASLGMSRATFYRKLKRLGLQEAG